MEATINKRFLLSTLAEVGAHNRREQEEQCWRRHHLETVTNRATVVHERNGKRKIMKDDNTNDNRHRNIAGR